MTTSAWSTPPTAAPGDLLTAAYLNSYVNANLEALRARASAKVTRTYPQNIDFGTWAIIDFAGEAWDTASIHSTATLNSRLTIPTGAEGRWQFDCSVCWDVSVNGDRSVAVRKNGSAFTYLSRERASIDAHWLSGNVTLNMAAGDWAELAVWHSGPSTMSGGLDVTSATFTATFVGGTP